MISPAVGVHREGGFFSSTAALGARPRGPASKTLLSVLRARVPWEAMGAAPPSTGGVALAAAAVQIASLPGVQGYPNCILELPTVGAG